jgi:hypothetical protein
LLDPERILANQSGEAVTPFYHLLHSPPDRNIVLNTKGGLTMSKLLKVCFVLFFAVVLVAAESPWVGTWKLDPAKSRLAPYPKSTKEMTVTTRDLGNDTFETTFKGTAVDGTPISRKITVGANGGPTTWLEGGPPAGYAENTTVANDRVRDSIYTHDGKKISETHIALSEDGKSVTVTTKGVNINGKPLDTMLFFERQ